jgi:hypothetical protein
LSGGAKIPQNWTKLVDMKRTIKFFFCIALVTLVLPAYGQVVPSASAHEPTITAGGFGSIFQPDYAGNGIAQASPQRLYGIGAYVDVKLNRWIGVEGEGRWMRFNEYIGIGEDNYLIGPKVPITTYKGLTPYGKFLVGFGSGSFLNGHSTVLTYGGGVDYKLSKHFTLRAFDFEYQQWLLTPTLYPYGGSVGLGYKFF